MVTLSRRQSGFTIVELLIVIVIIGILATITIVAYNGIQQRARNTQVISGVDAYQKVILQYATVNSSYPDTSGCLGADYADNQCWNGTSGTWSVSSTLDNELASFLGNKPTLATTRFSIGIGNNMRAGALYSYISASKTARIVYYLEGASQSCAISGATAVTEGGIVTQCSINYPAL